MGVCFYRRHQNGSVPRGLGTPGSPQMPTNEFVLPQDDWSIVSKVAIATLTSQGTMGGLLVGGLLLKTVGWRVIVFSAGVYGGIYAYERLTWTNTAKCKEFKRQYVDHAARKLRLVVDMTSANCSHQVQQELSSTFARLCHLVDETTSEMKENIERSDKKLKRLEEASNKSKMLKNQANFIVNKLELFDQAYLKGPINTTEEES
jgi:mitofusin